MSVAVANAPCPKVKMVQEIFEKHNNEFEALTWPPQISIQFRSMGFAVQTNPILGGILEPDTTADLQGMESVPDRSELLWQKRGTNTISERWS